MVSWGDVTSSAATTRDLIDKIHASKGYKSLQRGERTAVDAIVQLSIQKPKPQAMYYLGHLLALVETPYRKPQNESATEASVTAYQTRSTTDGSSDWSDHEEFACNFLDRRWEFRLSSPGTGFKVFRIDRSQLTPRFVKVKVKLLGEPSYIAKLRMLEDSIEKIVATPGYILDLEFVLSSGFDVLTMNANSELWADAGNWTGSASTIAHELHHALGLDDRYDYILSHARNQDMPTNLRLYWFREQMKKGPDPRGDYSLMGGGGRLLSEDICAIGGPVRRNACEAAHSKYDPKGIPAKPKKP
jgi:hypothetical protein